MTTRYVGIGGSDAANGLTWATRKLTLNGVEDTPVVAGDIVYVGPGTYRELLTVDVNGSAGNVIQYIGDYLGTNTDGVGGVVRITGAAANDQSASRANCITATSKNYRSFTGFLFDTTTSTPLNISNCTFFTFDKTLTFVGVAGVAGINVDGASQSTFILSNSIVYAALSAYTIHFNHSSVVDNAAHVIQNCILIGAVQSVGVGVTRIGGITVKNSLIDAHNSGIQIVTAPTVGQTVTVNNNILTRNGTALAGLSTTQIIENYNTFYGNGANRANTNTGANSVTYPPLYDARWFFQLVFAGAGNNNASQVVSPFDLASYSALINLAGTSPSTTDMRGTAVQGAEREWGALEYDSTLKIKSAAGGAVAISPAIGNIG